MGGSERAFGDDDVGRFSMIQQAAEVQEGSHDWGEGGDGSEGRARRSEPAGQISDAPQFSSRPTSRLQDIAQRRHKGIPIIQHNVDRYKAVSPMSAMVETRDHVRMPTFRASRKGSCDFPP